jgi:hypothetical protein
LANKYKIASLEIINILGDNLCELLNKNKYYILERKFGRGFEDILYQDKIYQKELIYLV